MITLLITLLSAAFVATPAFGAAEAPKTIVLGENEAENINQRVSYFVDETSRLSIKDVVGGPHAWQRPTTDNVALDLGSRTVWIWLRLNNPADHATRAYVELNPIFLEYITAFDEGGRELDRTGSKVEPHRLEAFPTLILPIAPGTHDVYVAIRSRASAFALILRSEAKQAHKDSVDLMTASALLGSLLAFLVYHFFMFITYRNRNFLLYSLFIASIALFCASFTSYHRQLLPASILGFGIDFWWSAVAAEIISLCIYLFSADLLGLFPEKSCQHPRLARVLLLVPAFHVACLGAIVASNNPALLVAVRLSAVLQILLFPGIGVGLWLKNRTNKIPLYYAISWIPYTVGAVTIVCWLSGVFAYHDFLPWSLPIGSLVQSLLLSFAASQRLKARDQVITAFASSDIVTELNHGQDPLAFTPQNVKRCILFMDMHDYTKYSEANSPMACHQLLNQYFKIINATTYDHGGKVDKIIGDAVMIVFADPARCLKSIVQLRRNLSQLNRERVAANLMPIKFGSGVSYGTMLVGNFGTEQKLDRTLVGDTVNVASRLETITRQFAVDVLCSMDFLSELPGYEYSRPAGYVLLKGRQKKSLVYELFEHNLPEVVEWKISTRAILLEVIDLELNGHYVESINRINHLIKGCPSHTHKPGQIMDPTLRSMVAAIEEKMRQLGLPVPGDYRKAG